MAAFLVHTPTGPVTVEAVSRQVDDSGTLGLFGDDGQMTATFWPGEWADTPFAVPVAPVAAAPVVTEPDNPPPETAA